MISDTQASRSALDPPGPGQATEEPKMREHRHSFEGQICLFTDQKKEASMCGSSRCPAPPPDQRFDLIAPEDGR
jgi:hypothetical protein